MTQPWILSGSVAGEHQKDLTNQARAIGARYFGERDERCINVILTNATSETETLHADDRVVSTVVRFTADFTAEVKHDWLPVSYGFPSCNYCGKKKT